VSFVVTDCEGKERKGEWRSDGEEQEMEGTSCAKCYTDVGLRFSLMGDGMVIVGVQVHKDLGRGMHPGEEKWLCLTRGEEVTVQREESDFGRMRSMFLERDDELIAAAEEEGANARGKADRAEEAK
jgi:hypothetical protein